MGVDGVDVHESSAVPSMSRLGLLLVVEDSLQHFGERVYLRLHRGELLLRPFLRRAEHTLRVFEFPIRWRPARFATTLGQRWNSCVKRTIEKRRVHMSKTGRSKHRYFSPFPDMFSRLLRALLLKNAPALRQCIPGVQRRTRKKIEVRGMPLDASGHIHNRSTNPAC